MERDGHQFHAFKAVVDSFVVGDKVNRRTVDEGSRQGMTYAGVTANLQALQNADQQVLLHKEMVLDERNDPSAKRKACIQTLKGKSD